MNNMKINYPIGGYAPGFYSNTCISCKEEFTGDKYSRQCEPCAINSIKEGNVRLLERVKKLESILFTLQNSLNALKELI